MSCAPFNNPLDNALSYLYTNKAIDKDLNIKSNKINFYIGVLERQSGIPLFKVENNKLIPIQEAFDSIVPKVEEEIEVPTKVELTEKDYVERMNEGREAAVQIWKDSVIDLPSIYNEEQKEYLEQLFNKGILKLRCGI